MPVVNGASIMCSFGLAPGTLVVLPMHRTQMGNMPAANINDHLPFANITPFGMCNSLANPITAAQTAAALGVLTPGTCIPVTPAPWAPGVPTVQIGGMPAVDTACTLNCAYGGVITITNGGAPTVSVP